MSTTESRLSLLRSIVLMVGFKDDLFHGVCASLLLLGLQGGDFTAAEIPREITQGDIHVSGAATRLLLEMALLEKVGYVPSPNTDANGRPVC
jgi:hypothetical protein